MLVRNQHTALSDPLSNGGDKLKILIAFVALVVLFTLTACGAEEVEVTREVEVTPVFDSEAEKEAVVAVSVGLDDDIANAN